MKIVIIDHEPYSESRKEQFFITEFLEKGYELEHWCIQPILRNARSVHYQVKTTTTFALKITSKADFCKKLKSLDAANTVVILEVWFSPDSMFIFEALHKTGIKWMGIDHFHNPADNFFDSNINLNPDRPKTKKDLKWLTTLVKLALRPGFLKWKIRKRTNPQFLQAIQTADVRFVTGNFRENQKPAKKIVAIDYFDIEKYNVEKNKKSLLDYKYIVFADIFWGSHPDILMLNEGETVNLAEYYQKMNNFFDYIERKYQLPVVIAAHPKASYTNEFGSRKIIKYQTANLIMNSDWVITHGSTSMSYALLAKRPLLHIYYNAFFASSFTRYYLESVKNVCNQIDGSLINIDEPLPEPFVFKGVNEAIYEDVLRKFFLKEEEKGIHTNFDVVERELLLLGNR